MTPGLTDAGRLADQLLAELPAARTQLETMIRIPSVSADPGNPAVSRCADLVAQVLDDAGAQARIVTAPDALPSVVARRDGAPGAPEVLLYAHFDVQPVPDRGSWTSDPFEPRVRGGRLYGRGSVDDKAGVALYAAILRALPDLSCNVTLLIEGEEEIGSPHLDAILDAARLPRPDLIIAADGANSDSHRPMLTTSLRGLVDCVVEVRTAERAVHSGLYGGAVPDALGCLVRLLDSLVDADGRVAVPGLRSSPSRDDLGTEADLLATVDAVPGIRLQGRGTLAERLVSGPAVTIVGIDAPPVAQATNQLVPVARAKVSLRIAPDEDPAAAIAALGSHLRADPPWGCQVTVRPGAVAPGLAASGGTYRDLAKRSLESAWDGAELVELGCGGSIPFIPALLRAYPQAQVLITGMQDDRCGAHAVDESLDLGLWSRALVGHGLLLAAVDGQAADSAIGAA